MGRAEPSFPFTMCAKNRNRFSLPKVTIRDPEHERLADRRDSVRIGFKGWKATMHSGTLQVKDDDYSNMGI